MDYNDIMIDIETLNKTPDAVIISIGAVKFNKDGLGDKFYININVDEQLSARRTVSGDTIQWWLNQSDEARSALDLANGYKSTTVLRSLNLFFDRTDYRVWGNGATFDNVIVSSYLKTFGAPALWKYNKDRCYRTLKALFDTQKVATEWAAPKDAHNALYDATAQASNAIVMLNHLNAWEN